MKTYRLTMDITEDQWEEFRKVQDSGVTNMLDIGRVAELSGLESSVIRYIIRHYGELSRKFAGGVYGN